MLVQHRYKYRPSKTFDWQTIQAEWRELAVKHAGQPEGVRFLTLLHSLSGWDGVCPAPKIFSLAPKPDEPSAW